jgi:putative transposase
LSKAERLALLDWQDPDLPIKTQARLLQLNRTHLYYQPAPVSPAELALKHRIDELYTVYPYCGSRRITALLQREGRQVNRKAVQRHMREMGIQGIAPGPNLSRRNREHRVFPYLLRGLAITAPNQVWGVDITYIRLVKGWQYLVAVMDWYSRYVVGWELDPSLEVSFVLRALRGALGKGSPAIINSDQGSQFTCPAYVTLMQAAGAAISMDGKGSYSDNIFTERLWRSLKYEDVYLHEYRSPREARRGIGAYLRTYNEERPHQALDYRTPAELYFGKS